MPEPVLVDRENGYVIARINRPDRLNALNPDVLLGLDRLLDEVAADSTVRVLIVTGEGRAFSAGGDIEYLKNQTFQESLRWRRLGIDVLRRLERESVVTIAAINGYALGGGLELALACDIRIAAEGAAMGLPELRIGAMPGLGGTQRLPRLIGMAMAKELIFTGRRIPARDAMAFGILNRVVSADQLVSTCVALAEEILQTSPSSLRQAKRAMANGTEMTLAEGLEMEFETISVNYFSKERGEGLSSFLEKRPANYSAR